MTLTKRIERLEQRQHTPGDETPGDTLLIAYQDLGSPDLVDTGDGTLMTVADFRREYPRGLLAQFNESGVWLEGDGPNLLEAPPSGRPISRDDWRRFVQEWRDTHPQRKSEATR